MSENDIKAWRLSGLKPEECTGEELIRRLVQNAYAHGYVGHKKGLSSEGAKRLERCVERDRAEALRRLS